MGVVGGYCKDCKYWEEYKPDEDDYVDEQWLGWGDCLLTKSDMGLPANSDTLACATDKESYKAVLQTRPLFGCIQFQPKE